MKIFFIGSLALLLTSCTKQAPAPTHVQGLMAPQVRSAEHTSFPLAETVASPNGQHAIQMTSTAKINPGDERKWWEATLRILDQGGKSIYEDPESYALWFRFQVRWLDDSTIELISGDVGKRMYTMTDGVWEKRP